MPFLLSSRGPRKAEARGTGACSHNFALICSIPFRIVWHNNREGMIQRGTVAPFFLAILSPAMGWIYISIVRYNVFYVFRAQNHHRCASVRSFWAAIRAKCFARDSGVNGRDHAASSASAAKAGSMGEPKFLILRQRHRKPSHVTVELPRYHLGR